jgi:RNA polymerase sigma factor (sigma-70 family)
MLPEMSETDIELIARYTREHAEDAFAELVRRHLGLVYSAALRQVRSPQLAEEVSQSVFTDLARNAARLKSDTVLSAWLYQVTRRTAIDVVRREASRQLREQVALEMNAMNATAADWSHIEPLLDDAMHSLDDADRAAVLLRYFDNKSLREVGQALGASENAAQKRLTRAVDRLREFFTKRGVTVGASGLVGVISANAVQAAPMGLAVTISSAAVLAGTIVTTTAVTTAIATKAIVMTTLQKTIIGATLAVAIGTGIFEVRQISRLRAEVHTLQQQHASVVEENDRLLREREEAANRLAALANDMARTKAIPTELLRLRGEVTRLGAELRQSPMTRIASLKRKLEQMPDKKIPELLFLTEKD